MTTNPLSTHLLDQYLAFSLELHIRLLGYRNSLVEVGWNEAEAWAMTQKVEERLLGPLLDSLDQVKYGFVPFYPFLFPYKN